MVQVVGCIADARSGVEANRFAENLTLFEFRQMFEDKRMYAGLWKLQLQEDIIC